MLGGGIFESLCSNWSVSEEREGVGEQSGGQAEDVCETCQKFGLVNELKYLNENCMMPELY